MSFVRRLVLFRRLVKTQHPLWYFSDKCLVKVGKKLLGRKCPKNKLFRTWRHLVYCISCYFVASGIINDLFTDVIVNDVNHPLHTYTVGLHGFNICKNY